MSEYNTSSLDADHEIEEFLQECIVDKITANSNTTSEEIRKELIDLQGNIKSAETSLTGLTGNIDTLSSNIRDTGDQVQDLEDAIKKLKNSSEALNGFLAELGNKIPSNDTIADRIVNELSGFYETSILPIRSEISICCEEIHQLKTVMEQLALIDEEINTLCELTQASFNRTDRALLTLNENIQTKYNNIGARADFLDSAIAALNEKSTAADATSQKIMSMEQSSAQVLAELVKNLKTVWVLAGINIVLTLIMIVLFFVR